MKALQAHLALYQARRADRAYRSLSPTAKGYLEDLAHYCADNDTVHVPHSALARAFGTDGNRTKYLAELTQAGFLRATVVKTRKDGKVECDYTVARFPALPANANASAAPASDTRGDTRSDRNLGGGGDRNATPVITQESESPKLAQCLLLEEKEEKRLKSKKRSSAAAASPTAKEQQAARQQLAHIALSAVLSELQLPRGSVSMGFAADAAHKRAVELVGPDGDVPGALMDVFRAAVPLVMSGREKSMMFAVGSALIGVQTPPMAPPVRAPRQAPAAPASAFKHGHLSAEEQIELYERRMASERARVRAELAAANG